MSHASPSQPPVHVHVPAVWSHEPFPEHETPFTSGHFFTGWHAPPALHVSHAGPSQSPVQVHVPAVWSHVPCFEHAGEHAVHVHAALVEVPAPDTHVPFSLQPYVSSSDGGGGGGDLGFKPTTSPTTRAVAARTARVTNKAIFSCGCISLTQWYLKKTRILKPTRRPIRDRYSRGRSAMQQSFFFFRTGVTQRAGRNAPLTQVFS